MDDRMPLLWLCALKVGDARPDWSLLAREVGRVGDTSLLQRATVIEQSKAADETRAVLQAASAEDWDAARERVQLEMAAAGQVGAELVTVHDPDYPANLRRVPDRPPFLFVLGQLRSDDVRAVAVVGTRSCSEPGRARARNMSRMLVGEGVTVVSGLAEGIDTEAHTAALDAGGRTIAVLGTGITRCYPPSNEELSERIHTSGQGALVSQFWPTSGPARWTFPRRNRVTSGISQGTVVIEASSTSGAKMQARIALEHGKRVWLVKSLVTSQAWARTYVAERGAVEVSTVDDVLDDLHSVDTIEQLSAQQQRLTLDVV